MRGLLVVLAVVVAGVVVPAAGAAGLAAVGAATPGSVTAGGAVLLTVTVTPAETPASTGVLVICDLSSIGGSTLQFLVDDGSEGDVVAGDQTFSFLAHVDPATSPGAKSIACTVSDAQARVISLSILLSVTTLAPANLPPAADAGGPYSVAEGGQLTLTGTGSDPEGGTVSFAWDLNDDGVFETPGQTVTFSAATIDGPATREISVRVSDESGAATVASTTVSVTNVAPTGSLVAAATVVAGTPFALSVANLADPSAADTAAGFAVAFDCGDGQGYNSPTTISGESASFTCPLPLSLGERQVGVRISDKDGGTSEYRAGLTVTLTYASLCELVRVLSQKPGIAQSLCAKLVAASAAATPTARQGRLIAFRNELTAQAGKALTEPDAQLLEQLSQELDA